MNEPRDVNVQGATHVKITMETLSNKCERFRSTLNWIMSSVSSILYVIYHIFKKRSKCHMISFTYTYPNKKIADFWNKYSNKTLPHF